MQYEPKKKHFKTFVAKVVFFVLKRGIKGCYKYDSDVNEMLASLPEGTVFKLGIISNTPNIVLVKENNKLVSSKDANIKPTLEIDFKNVDAAFPLLIGKAGVSQAFAEGRFILRGNVDDAINIAHSMDVVENYLFPRFITKKFIPHKIKKQVSSFKIYAYIVFGR
ncbi:MAG: hypothetical protein RRY78_01735 [Clostridia bacterium]